MVNPETAGSENAERILDLLRLQSSERDQLRAELAAAAQREAKLRRALACFRELCRGDGTFYIPQERAFAPGSAGEWPGVIPKPKDKNGQLVKRVVPSEVRAFVRALTQEGREP